MWNRRLWIIMKPKITHVAIRFGGEMYSLPAPNRHHHIIWHIADKLCINNVDASEDDQGFLDEDGNYLTREQALERALETNQVKDINNIRAGILFSEDLW